MSRQEPTVHFECIQCKSENEVALKDVEWMTRMEAMPPFEIKVTCVTVTLSCFTCGVNHLVRLS